MARRRFLRRLNNEFRSDQRAIPVRRPITSALCDLDWNSVCACLKVRLERQYGLEALVCLAAEADDFIDAAAGTAPRPYPRARRHSRLGHPGRNALSLWR